MSEQMVYNGPMRFVHRGLAQEAPENTIGAFEGVVKHGYEGIEIDIQRSLDGRIVVAHDCNFTRMTLGHPTMFSNRKICDMTWEEISKMQLPYANHLLPKELPPHSDIEQMLIVPGLVMGQVQGRDYETALRKDSRMASLMLFETFDAWLSEQTVKPVVEVEVKAGGMMPELKRILDASTNVEQYILFSGVPEFNEEIQNAFAGEKTKGLRLGANVRFLNEGIKQWIRQADLYEVGLNADCFGKQDVCWLNEQGIKVLSNLGDYPEWWEKMCELEILGFKTNYAQAFTQWWEMQLR